MTEHQHRMRAELVKQLGFLARDCSAFDAGHVDQGARIAAALRTLLYDHGKKMVSVLTHLGMKDRVQLLSTCHPRVHPPGTVVFEGLIGLSASRGFGAKLGCSSFKGTRTVREWLDQVVLISAPGERWTRQSLLLRAANQDGGVHVDSTLPPEYERLKAGLWTVQDEKDGVTYERRITDHQYHTLRQMGYEVLNSDDLSRAAEA